MESRQLQVNVYLIFVLDKHILCIVLLCEFPKPCIVLQHRFHGASITETGFYRIGILFDVDEMFSDIPAFQLLLTHGPEIPDVH